MSFLRHEEIYPPMEARLCRAPAHRWDEFPTGYSLAGCSPAEPASASPVSLILLQSRSFVEDFSANGNPSLISVSHSRGALQCLSPLCPSAYQDRVESALHYRVRPLKTYRNTGISRTASVSPCAGTESTVPEDGETSRVTVRSPLAGMPKVQYLPPDMSKQTGAKVNAPEAASAEP